MLSRFSSFGRIMIGLVLLGLGPIGTVRAQIRDGGINPANLGNGDWIYFLSAATNKLGSRNKSRR